MVRKAAKQAEEPEINVDTVESQRLEAQAMDQGVRFLICISKFHHHLPFFLTLFNSLPTTDTLKNAACCQYIITPLKP